ncbi:MAG TPA: TetR/AcrR family transcriptional regulator [Saprospiraceae bacterium]|nr:TetR/AcrR family transcriptional regulator [Saprospiraceae bacterium]HMQ81378.1 TetR/AcrR family transcriptional regulator [Saprospiraceae bacterium]
MDLKQQILEKSFDLFMRYGIKSITMDDIAKELGISKKTLYQYVENKTDLIEQIFHRHIDEEKQAIDAIRQHSSDAIDEMLGIAKHVINELRTVSANVLYDLQKYYPPTWAMMEGLQKKHIFTVIKENLERGIRQGLYRANLNADIIAKLYVGKAMLLIDDDFFPLQNYNISDLYREYIYYHIHGIASAKGQQLLEKHLVLRTLQ